MCFLSDLLVLLSMNISPSSLWMNFSPSPLSSLHPPHCDLDPVSSAAISCSKSRSGDDGAAGDEQRATGGFEPPTEEEEEEEAQKKRDDGEIC